MKQQSNSHRRAIGLLLAAAALPLSPALAQDVTALPAQPPVVAVTPPAPVPAPDVAQDATPPEAVTPPVANPAPAPVPDTNPTAEPAPPRANATIQRRSATRSATRTVTRAPAVVASRAPASAPAAQSAPVAAATPALAAEPAPAPVAETAAPASEPAPAPAQQVQSNRFQLLPWLVGALVLIGAAALLLRRRRRTDEIYEDELAGEPEIVAPPAMGVPLAAEAFVPPVATAASVETGRPAISFEMRPVRAGVNAEDAIVEFELTVDNRGDGPASDVRVSTWMFPAGHGSDAERALITPAEDTDLPPITIQSGHAKRIDSAVALPTAGMAEDNVLPVVVAQATYRLPDGTEERTTASFEVGVPIGNELAHFDLDNPSGMHDDVVARPHREVVEA